MKSRILFAAMTAILLVPKGAIAQEVNVKDSIPSTKEVKNRNVMLNASSDNQPRSISIGLPNVSTGVFEDGLPVSYNVWPCVPYKIWRSGASEGKISLLSLGETALRTGAIGYTVDSYSREGGDKFLGLLNYTVNHFGKQTFDMNLSGGIKNGWSYSVGSYQNFDPGSNPVDYAMIQDRLQIYKAGLTKRWNENKGKASLFYQYGRSTSLGDSNGPFYYLGDGKTRALEGFDLGRDSYIPSTTDFSFLDVMTGEMRTMTLKDGNTDKTHQLAFLLDYQWDNGVHLAIRSKFKDGETRQTSRALSGIDEVTSDRGYTYEDGTPFTGNVQNRYILHYEGFERNWLTTAELTGHRNNHAWRIGLSEWYNRAGIETSTANMAHEVTATPKQLMLDSNRYWGFNNGSEYYNGHEHKLSLYLSDDWVLSPRLQLSAGVRAEYFNIGGRAAMNLDGKTNNSRIQDFNLKMDGTEITRFKDNKFNAVGTFNFHYALVHGFGIQGEYVFTRQHTALSDYAGSDFPDTTPVDAHMASGGVFWNNKWMQLVSRFTFISQSNYKSRSQFTKQIDGMSETVTSLINYDVATMGWTTDVVLTPFKGFMFHGLFTLQNPLYKNFVIQPVFSDGSSETHDFTDKVVTGMSKIIVELDPSYTAGDWRFWLSFRYQDKQYINKTNSLYFDGRWETFGGMDYKLNKHVTLTASVVNFLNQKGVSGSIGVADLVEDASQFRNYLMAGNYIRPFTFELTARVNF